MKLSKFVFTFGYFANFAKVSTFPFDFFLLTNYTALCQYFLAMTKEDFSKFEKLITGSLAKFWDQVLEPAFNKIDERFSGVEKRLDGVEERLDGVEERLDGVEKELNGVGNVVDSIDRRLESESSYRDRLDERVRRVETKLDLPHSP